MQFGHIVSQHIQNFISLKIKTTGKYSIKMHCLFSFFQESTVAAWYEQVRMEICVVQFVYVCLMFQLHLVHVCVFVNKEYILLIILSSAYVCIHKKLLQLPHTTTYNSKYYYMYMYIFIHLFLCLCYQLVGGGEAFSITFFSAEFINFIRYSS